MNPLSSRASSDIADGTRKYSFVETLLTADWYAPYSFAPLLHAKLCPPPRFSLPLETVSGKFSLRSFRSAGGSMNSYVLERSLRGERGCWRGERGERERRIRQEEKNEMSKPRESEIA